MGLFDKKNCDICGGKIGMLGNRKLEDGNCCKDCASRLSPFFSERRKSTVADINAQLAYRQENMGAVAAFRTTRTLGQGTKVLLDEDSGKFMVTKARRLEDENPDVLDFSQVTGCNIEVREQSRELKQRNKEGKEVSYIPPRWEYKFDFECLIHVNHPWFNEIRFNVNDRTINVQTTGSRSMTTGGRSITAGGRSLTTGSRIQQSGGAEIGRGNNDYRNAEALGNEIKNALTQVRRQVRTEAAAASAPKTAQTCPLCGATCIPDASGRCEYCGGAMG